MVAQNHIHRLHWHRLTVAPWREIGTGPGEAEARNTGNESAQMLTPGGRVVGHVINEEDQ